jgi:predicted metal-dependent TIM-barrel fold hydrolase
MRFFDPHIHMISRTTDDYQSMAASGVRAVIEPAFWIGQPRTSLGTFVDYFNQILGWERFRASQFGIAHYCAIGLNSKEANNEPLAKEVLAILPRFVCKEGVVAVGEIGYDEITSAEDCAYEAQVALARAHDMVVMVHSPHRDKKRGIRRSLEVAQAAGLSMQKLVIDHNNEETVEDVLNAGAWAAFTIYPHTKMGSERMVELVKKYGPERMIVDSSADWGISDPLSVPRTAALMLQRGIPQAHVELVCYRNALAAYAQSGQIDLAALERSPEVDQRQLWSDNSVLRGQSARVGASEGAPPSVAAPVPN